jgi:hypothetical protein
MALIAARVADIAKRLCGVETWRRLAQDLIEHGGDDIIKLEERVDAQSETIAEQAERIVRLELLLGVAIQRRDVEG